jgi:hypothetical protein
LNNNSIISLTDLDTVYNVFSFLTVDFDGNRQINILDITRVAAAFNSYPGHEKWNAKVDVDDSLTINIIDITRVAKEFGKPA